MTIPDEPPPQDGSIIQVHVVAHFKWTSYSPKSEQFRKGIKGRWQSMNEYGGWDNTELPQGAKWSKSDGHT